MKRPRARQTGVGRHRAKRVAIFHPNGWDGTRFLMIFCGLLYLIPAPLIVRPIGAAGTPAALWAMTGLLWWLCARSGGLIRGSERNPVAFALGVFVLAVLASYAWAMTTGWYSPAGIQGSTDDLYDLVLASPQQLRTVMLNAADRGLLELAAWVGIVLMCLAALRSWEAIDRLMRWIVCLASVVAFIGLIEFFTGWNISGLIRIPGLVANSEFGGVQERSVLRRVAATATHPIEFGVVMGACFPFGIHRALFATRHRVRAWMPPSMIGSAAMMSVSRSAVLVMGIALIIMFVGWPGAWRSRALVVAPVAAVALRLLVPGLLGTILSMWTNLFADTSTQGRTGDYGVVLRVFTDNPVFGRGLYTFVPRYYRIIDNQLLVTLVELGLIGMTAFLVLVGAAYLSARGVRRRAVTAEHRHLGLVLSASIAGMFVSFATFDAFSYPMASGTFFLLFGVAAAGWQLSRADQREADADSAPRPEPEINDRSARPVGANPI